MKQGDKIYYWAPSIFWNIIENGNLKIENTIFEDDIGSLFPEFYFLTGNGCTLAQIEEKFSDYQPRKLKKFINLLIKEKILICEIQDVEELFYGQSKMYEQYNTFNETIKYDEQQQKRFVQQQLTREKEFSGIEINLAKTDTLGNVIKNRKSIRKFDTNKVVSFETMSAILQVLEQQQIDTKRKYYYPSAGGLYPIDCYIYFKSNRVEGIESGLYYYNPIAHKLLEVCKEEFTKNIHYFTNQNIFESSACSIFFVYHGDANMAKYEDRAYFYAIIDAGIMAELLTMHLEEMGMGSCIIGEMDFKQIEPYFALEANEKFLFNMEIGMKKEA